ncbi:dihydrofolate reductase family protein [Nonomuraea sp. NPDC059023]|uniref:dihydrofolate reductase family protein n=1 Tax=unclassified Nonomuraea TaxID=2593643 RepID=UPI0036AA4E88
MSNDAVDVVARLKEEPELPLRSHSNLSMNQALMAAGLVDRVQLALFPVVTGQTGAANVDSLTTSTGGWGTMGGHARALLLVAGGSTVPLAVGGGSRPVDGCLADAHGRSGRQAGIDSTISRVHRLTASPAGTADSNASIALRSTSRA